MKFPKLNTPYIIALAITILFSFILTFVMFSLQPIEFSDYEEIINNSSSLFIWLNFIPILIIMLFLLFATNNVIISVFITSFIVVILSLINRFKILLRHDPLFFWDFSLVEELFVILQTFSASFIFYTIFGIVLFVCLFVLFFNIVKTEKLSSKLRIISSSIIAIIAIIVNITVYSNEELFNSLYVLGSRYNLVNVNNSKGFLLSFIHTTNTNRLRKPANYSDIEILEYKDNFEFAELETETARPHIIAIMGEAFSEVPNSEQLIYSVRPNPISFYNDLKGSSIHGNIIVPNMGGGTADTEFDFLTGLNSRYLTGIPYSYRLVNRDFVSLASILRDIGYNPIAIHPGHEWFYNRGNVYPHLGFNFFISGGYFDPTETKGGYIKESVTIDKIIEVFYENLEQHPDYPLFSFTVTIQNHGPYEDKNFGGFEGLQFATAHSLTNSEIDAIENYLIGSYDADQGIRTLIEHFEHHDEPVVIIYFGDHMPGLSFDILDYLLPPPTSVFEDYTRYYRTPFFIWQNHAAKPLTHIEENMEMLNGITLGSPYLGTLFLELLGHNSIYPFFDFINELRLDTSTVNLEHMDFFHYEDVDDVDNKIEMYRNWNFFKVFTP